MHNDRSSSNCQFIYPHDVIQPIDVSDKHAQSSFGGKLQEFTMELLLCWFRVRVPSNSLKLIDLCQIGEFNRNNDMVTRNDLAVEMLQMQWSMVF